MESETSFCIHVGRPAVATFDDVPRNQLHRHSYFEPCLVLAGHGEFEYDGRRYPLMAGDLFLAGPGVYHEITSLETKDLRVAFTSFVVEPSRAGDADPAQDEIVRAFIAGHETARRRQHALGAAFEQVLRVSSALPTLADRYLFAERMRLLVLQAMAALTIAPSTAPAAGSATLDRALSAIETRLHEPLSVGAVAGAALVSARSLRRLFRAQLGRTVSEEIQRRRVQRAAMLLALSELPVAEVGRRVGVGDPAQFTRLFRKVLGVAPRRFRTMRTPASTEWAIVGDVPMRTEYQ